MQVVSHLLCLPVSPAVAAPQLCTDRRTSALTMAPGTDPMFLVLFLEAPKAWNSSLRSLLSASKLAPVSRFPELLLLSPLPLPPSLSLPPPFPSSLHPPLSLPLSLLSLSPSYPSSSPSFPPLSTPPFLLSLSFPPLSLSLPQSCLSLACIYLS